MISFTPRLHFAIELAARLHRDQIRKDAGRTPYITHLVGVMIILSEITDDENTLIAGLMHDSIEDVKGYSYEQLVKDCGKEVADIVLGVTETRETNSIEDIELRWMTTRKQYLETLAKAGDESLYVSLADKLHNLTTLLDGYKKEGDELLKKFYANKRNMLWFYDEIYALASSRLTTEHLLVKKLAITLKEVHAMFKV